MGISLLLIGVGAVVLSAAVDSTGKVSLVDAQGDICEEGRRCDAPVNAGARNPVDTSAHNSPTLVRNPVRPNNLAVTDRIDTPFFSCSFHVTTDGGASWTQIPIPFPKGEEAKCFAPDVAFSADGTLSLAFVTLRGGGNVPNAVWVSTSKDGGRTLSKPVRARPNRLAFQVRLAADPVKPKRLYMTWLQGTSVGPLKFTQLGNPIQSSRSDDGGVTWTRPVRVSNPRRQRVIAGAPVVGRNGDFYTLYVDMRGDSLDYEAGHRGRGGPPYGGNWELVLARSQNQGVTWQESVVDEKIKPIQRFIVFTPAFPSVAVDRDNRVYAAFHDRRLGDPDVWLWSLEPGSGSRWKGPKRVNDTKEKDRRSQYLPKIATAPNGRLDVLYYDRRSDPRNLLNRVSLQSSFDHGDTFTPAEKLSSDPSDSRIGYGAKEGLPDLGSRLGLISDNRSALGLWTDTREGTPQTQKQDLAQAVVSVKEPSGLAAVVKYGLLLVGILLALAGLAMSVLWFRGPQTGSASA